MEADEGHTRLERSVIDHYSNFNDCPFIFDQPRYRFVSSYLEIQKKKKNVFTPMLAGRFGKSSKENLVGQGNAYINWEQG